jgi:hypothetical protein
MQHRLVVEAPPLGQRMISPHQVVIAMNGVERVINIKTCPLCHQPRLKNKGEMDIVTHLAICASGDWARVDRIMVSNFVTASQAKRKWYTMVMNKVTTGAYSLGAVSGLRSHTFWLPGIC